MANQIPYETTLHVRDHCLCLAVQRAARALARRFDEAFRPLGITSGQYSLLMSLNRPEPPPMSAVAAVLAMDRTTLTANLKPLEQRGLISSRPAAGDRRRRLLELTQAGTDLLAAAYPIWADAHARVDSELAAVEGTLRDGLAKLA